MTNRTANKQITPKIANTISWLMLAVIIGKNRPTANDPSQFIDEASPLALPLIPRGNISPTITHVRGAHVNE